MQHLYVAISATALYEGTPYGVSTPSCSGQNGDMKSYWCAKLRML